jgi:hypothetical protein
MQPHHIFILCPLGDLVLIEAVLERIRSLLYKPKNKSTGCQLVQLGLEMASRHLFLLVLDLVHLLQTVLNYAISLSFLVLNMLL